MNFLAALLGGAAQGIGAYGKSVQDEERAVRMKQLDADLETKRQETIQAMRDKADQAKEERQAKSKDAERTKRVGEINSGVTGLIGSMKSDNPVANPETWTAEQESARNAGLAATAEAGRADVANNLGYYAEGEALGRAQNNKDLQSNRLVDNMRADRTETRTADYQTRSLDEQIRARKAAEGRAGEGSELRKVQTEAAQLALDEAKQTSKLYTTYESATDPKEKAAAREALIARGKIKEGDYGTVATKSTDANGNEVTTTRKQTGGPQANTKQTEEQAQADAQRFINAGKISQADANKRLAAAGFKPLSVEPSGPVVRSLQELRRIAAKPRGVSSAEASKAQDEIDYINSHPDRMRAF